MPLAARPPVLLRERRALAGKLPVAPPQFTCNGALAGTDEQSAVFEGILLKLVIGLAVPV